jgi:protein-S-isoprenylcysteine O-methyltransferase Ste14
MDTARYYVALALIIFVPGSLMYWLSVHPFITFWRKLGKGITLGVNLAGIALVGMAFYRWRQPLLVIEFGTNYLLVALAVPLLIISGILRSRISRHLSIRTLLGIPEMEQSSQAGTLLTEGIYGRIRHPRYVQILIALLAYALIANYLVVYALLIAAIGWTLLIVRIEERELLHRFGSQYADYCRQVGRFFPRARH